MKQAALPVGKTPVKSKVAIVYTLYTISVLILLSGIFFGVYSAMNGLTIRVMNADVPGFVFGLLVTYLGFRYFLSVRKLQPELYKPDARFSWDNFKKTKK